jgi:F0F1-type ATP synthase delta subunit
MQKDLIVTKWQKSAVRSAIKAALIEKKLMKLLSDPKLTNKDLARILRECVTSEPVQKFLSVRDSKE